MDFLRTCFWRIFLKKIGKDSIVEKNVYITSPALISIGINSRIGVSSGIIPGSGPIEIGNNTSFGGELSLIGGKRVVIGNDVLIGPGCKLYAFSHNFSNKNILIRNQGTTEGIIVIEDDVWVGANVVILNNVTIGKGSVIAAGAVVNRNVKPFSVVGGVPAKFIKKRG